MTTTNTEVTCPVCGAGREPDATFCEACGHDFTGQSAPAPAPPGSPGARSAAAAGAAPTMPTGRHELAPVASDAAAGSAQSGSRSAAETQVRQAPVRAQTAAEGEESPLDVGWTGPVAGRGAALEVEPTTSTCVQCGTGHFQDGYCDTCGAKEPNPRDHFAETPAEWLAGVCDIGARKRRNEDAMALLASARPLQQGVIVVCDGVSNATDSHLASLAAARAAREVLDDPVPHAMGLVDALTAALERRIGEAVVAARRAVVEATNDPDGQTPPSCTFVAAIIDDGLVVAGNVGDSRAYWLPDAPASSAVQLGADDSFAAEQMREGMPRKEAETGANAHAITRWLGIDSPDDLTPHTGSLRPGEDGWLLVCSDGLWNYCSEPADLRELVARTVVSLGAHGRNPQTLAQALVDFANAQGGHDNITVALARVGATEPPAPEPAPAAAQEVATPEVAAAPAAAPVPEAATPAEPLPEPGPEPLTPPAVVPPAVVPPAVPHVDGEVATDGTVHH